MLRYLRLQYVVHYYDHTDFVTPLSYVTFRPRQPRFSTPYGNPRQQFSRAVSEVWRAYEMKHKPAFVLDVRLPPGSFDVNVTPDKREIFMTEASRDGGSLTTYCATPCKRCSIFSPQRMEKRNARFVSLVVAFCSFVDAVVLEMLASVVRPVEEARHLNACFRFALYP